MRLGGAYTGGFTELRGGCCQYVRKFAALLPELLHLQCRTYKAAPHPVLKKNHSPGILTRPLHPPTPTHTPAIERSLVLILPVEFHCRYVVRICSLRCCWLFNKQLTQQQKSVGIHASSAYRSLGRRYREHPKGHLENHPELDLHRSHKSCRPKRPRSAQTWQSVAICCQLSVAGS